MNYTINPTIDLKTLIYIKRLTIISLTLILVSCGKNSKTDNDSNDKERYPYEDILILEEHNKEVNFILNTNENADRCNSIKNQFEQSDLNVLEFNPSCTAVFNTHTNTDLDLDTKIETYQSILPIQLQCGLLERMAYNEDYLLSDRLVNDLKREAVFGIVTYKAFYNENLERFYTLKDKYQDVSINFDDTFSRFVDNGEVVTITAGIEKSLNRLGKFYKDLSFDRDKVRDIPLIIVNLPRNITNERLFIANKRKTRRRSFNLTMAGYCYMSDNGRYQVNSDEWYKRLKSIFTMNKQIEI